MTPLERAARALIDINPSISGYHQSHIDVMLPKVRAVIAAIREPDDLMEDRADVILIDARDAGQLAEPGAIWQTMIDALLEEGR